MRLTELVSHCNSMIEDYGDLEIDTYFKLHQHLLKTDTYMWPNEDKTRLDITMIIEDCCKQKEED